MEITQLKDNLTSKQIQYIDDHYDKYKRNYKIRRATQYEYEPLVLIHM